jgi:outer membrane protein OmpA-like peptidoglycan-associated protein
MKKITMFALALGLVSFAQAQSSIDGYVFEQNNRGFLSDALVSVYELPDNYVRGQVVSDKDGHFVMNLNPGRYKLVTKRDLFYSRTDTVEVGAGKPTYAKIEMKRKPGYLFDASLAEARTNDNIVVDAVTGARVEIYNRTNKRPELVLLDNPNAFFQFTFEQGNHYTIMIRKPGYIAKRIEARVNVEGCIICVDGVREVNPGVTDVLTEGNSMGTLLSNIEMEKIKLDKRISIQNIYYDYDKWFIRDDARPHLDKVVTLMQDNPTMSVELGSHTDSRGRDEYNETLSQRRAEAAVEYIVSQGVDASRITAKGYGENQLTNRCKNDVPCSEAEHQLNRRTELRITGISADDLEMKSWRSLEQIINDEEFSKEMKKVGKTSQIRITQGGLPEANNSTPLPKPNIKQQKWTLVGKGFTAYTVQVMEAGISLDPADTYIDDFAQPIYFWSDAEQNYYYGLGQFKTEAAAKQFLTPEVLKFYPQARVIQFKQGNIVK